MMKNIHCFNIFYFFFSRFTSMVEGHILDICMCLRDSNVVVRCNTLKLLFELIREDYLKVRCPLFFHLLILLCDKEESIQGQIREFIVNCVLEKYKNIMFQHFIEGMFYYNACYVCIHVVLIT